MFIKIYIISNLYEIKKNADLLRTNDRSFLQNKESVDLLRTNDRSIGQNEEIENKGKFELAIISSFAQLQCQHYEHALRISSNFVFFKFVFLMEDFLTVVCLLQ